MKRRVMMARTLMALGAAEVLAGMPGARIDG